ncbi:MAG TPA: N-acetylglucosamine-6-phosphate deacetylase, partial [Beijerinckiaceae bacterium]|nr:N-acetylglucosamine-6-phosphate deacetylase [Beijerinckiaceae bacterium]
MSAVALLAERVFDGLLLHEDVAVIVEGERIAALAARTDLPAELPVERVEGWLAPGFVDVQVNGGGDVLFNDDPTPEGAIAIARAHRRFGTTGLLPTLITDRPEAMRAGIAAVREAMRREPGILGIHLEGPFISPDKPGVHRETYIRRPGPEDLDLLRSLDGGVTVVTLAPEIVPEGFVGALARAGVRVCLGHSMATYEETRAALAEGLSGFTHLFNAMRPLGSRDPGPIAAALETPGCGYGLIVDGEHVHPAMLRLALRGAGTPMLVTDAMPCVGGRPGFSLYGEEIRVEGGRCLRADGTLAGAALDMASAVRNAVRLLGLDLAEALATA